MRRALWIAASVLAVAISAGAYFVPQTPQARILTPQPDATVASSYMVLTAEAPPGSCWRIVLDGAEVSKACAAAGGRLHRVIRAGQGRHEIGMRSVDNPAIAVSVSARASGVGTAPKVAVDWQALEEADIMLAHSSGHDQAGLFDPVYTHAALYLGPDSTGAPVVLEALTADLAEGLGEVRALPLERTWVYRDAVRVDIFRLAQTLRPEQRAAIVKFGQSVASRHLPYRSTGSFGDLYAAWLLWDPRADRPRNAVSFNAALERLREQKESMTSFDCATLVWRAYLEGTAVQGTHGQVDIGEPNRGELGGQLAGALSAAFLARINPYFLSVDSLYRSGKLVQVTRP